MKEQMQQQQPQQQAPEMAELEGMEPASPEEQKAYETAIAAVAKAIYEDDRTHQGVMKLLKADPGVGGIVKATTMLVAEIDKRLDLPETVIMELPMDIVDRLIELGEKAGIFKMEEQEMIEAAQLAVFETMRIYGMDEQGLQEMTSQISEKDANTLFDVYNKVGGFQ